MPCLYNGDSEKYVEAQQTHRRNHRGCRLGPRGSGKIARFWV